MPNKIDLDFYETVIIYHVLKDDSYLGSIVDILDVKLFNNRDIRSIVKIICKFYDLYQNDLVDGVKIGVLNVR